MCTDALPVFSAQSGRRVWGRSAVQHCASSVFWETPGQSCAHTRIEWGNPVPTPGLSGAILPTPGLRLRWKNPNLGAGSAGLLCRAGRQECGALGVGRASTHWASPYSLGEPVLIGRARIGRARIGQSRIGRASERGWASQYSLGEPVLGEPSNEVGASHQTRLGEPVLRGRWASPYSLGEPVGRANFHSGLHSGQRLLGAPTVPARHQVPARHCACSARLVKCLLGTCPLGTSTY